MYWYNSVDAHWKPVCTPYVNERTNRDAIRMSEAQAAVQTDDSHAQSAGVQPAVAAGRPSQSDDH